MEIKIMKKFVCFLLIMFFGLNCHAIEIFPLSSAPSKAINGSVTSNSDKDIIILNSKNSIDTESLKQTAILASTLTTVTLATTRAASRRPSSPSPRGTYISPTGEVIEYGDPYIVQFDGINYVMVKDNPTKKWSKKDLVGINDTKTTIFKALKDLESDGDRTKLTANELKCANIRFVKLEQNGTLLLNNKKQDYNLNKINYIDMLNLRKTANSEETGIFGHFNLYLNTNNGSKKMVIGYVTLDMNKNLEILFK